MVKQHSHWKNNKILERDFEEKPLCSEDIMNCHFCGEEGHLRGGGPGFEDHLICYDCGFVWEPSSVQSKVFIQIRSTENREGLSI